PPAAESPGTPPLVAPAPAEATPPAAPTPADAVSAPGTTPAQMSAPEMSAPETSAPEMPGETAPAADTTAALPPGAEPAAAATPSDLAGDAATVTVSLTFDDTYQPQRDGATILEAHGLRGTFYVNSPVLHQASANPDSSYGMSIADVLQLQARGHDI